MMASASCDRDMPQFMVGTCLSMCPNAELRLRQREALVHPLEMAIGASGEKLKYGNPRMMVKEFSRSAAGNEIKPSDIRPLPVLAKTVKFLMTNSCCRSDMPWALVYQFVNDRLRAVRQDLCVQGVRNVDCIKLHLASIRFYVYAHYRTCEHEVADFDPYLNKKTLMETLTLILSLYRDLDEEELDTGGGPPINPDAETEEDWPEEENEEDVNERKITKDAETSEKDSHEETGDADACRRLEDLHLQREEGFSSVSDQSLRSHIAESLVSSPDVETREKMGKIEKYSIREEAEALYILVNFGSEEALNHTLGLPKSIRCSPLVSLVLEMNMAWLTCNYDRVLRLSSHLPVLFLCAFHSHIATVQRQALTILSRSHSCKGQLYNKDDLAKKLFFSDWESMTKVCSHYGITVSEAGVSFSKGTFKADTPMMKLSRTKWIEDQLSNVELSELLLPQELQDEDLNSYPEETEVYTDDNSKKEEAVPAFTEKVSEPVNCSDTAKTNPLGVDSIDKDVSTPCPSPAVDSICKDDDVLEPLIEEMIKKDFAEVRMNMKDTAVQPQPVEVECKDDSAMHLMSAKLDLGEDVAVQPASEDTNIRKETPVQPITEMSGDSKNVLTKLLPPSEASDEPLPQEIPGSNDLRVESFSLEATCEEEGQQLVAESNGEDMSMHTQSTEGNLSDPGFELYQLRDLMDSSTRVLKCIRDINVQASVAEADKYSATLMQPDLPELKTSNGHATVLPLSEEPKNYRADKFVKEISSENIVVETLPVSSVDSSLDASFQSLTTHTSCVYSTPELSKSAISDIPSSVNNETELRRRKRRDDKEVIAKRVKEMVEKQHASERWLEHKKFIFKSILLSIAFMLLGGGGTLLYQSIYT